MSEFDRAFDRLREANPEPTWSIEDKPTAHEMLAVVHERPRSEPVQRWSRGLLAAAAAAAIVVVVAVPALLFQLWDTDVPPTDTLPSTTVPQSTTTTTIPVLDPVTQALVENFVGVYNAGDVEAFAALLHPDFTREGQDQFVRSRETVIALYEVDVALNTEISLDCVPDAADAVCSPVRFDDLHRVLEIAPTTETAWYLTFEDGLLRSWSEATRALGATPYSTAAVEPFTDWVVANSPGVADATDFEQRFFSGGTQTWVPREGVADDLAALVADWATDVGIVLDSGG